MRILIDYDMSLNFAGKSVGAKRSPIKTEEELRSILRASKEFAPYLQVVGVMAYEAVVAGVQDANPDTPAQNPVARRLRQYAMPQIAEKRAAVPQIFEEEKIPLEIFNGGGTGSLNLAIKEPALTEIAAGSGILCSHLFNQTFTNLEDDLNFKFEPSIYFATQLTRFPSEMIATTSGGGIVASGDMGIDRLPKVVWPKGLELTKDEGAGEVQTPLEKQDKEIQLKLGQPIFWQPAKAGEPAERFKEYLLSKNGEFVGEAPTNRGFGKCFG